jgi:hypothetical protein
LPDGAREISVQQLLHLANRPAAPAHVPVRRNPVGLTGSSLPGALICGLFVTWYVVAGTATQAAF